MRARSRSSPTAGCSSPRKPNAPSVASLRMSERRAIPHFDASPRNGTALAPKQSLRVSEQELAAALASISPESRHALEDRRAQHPQVRRMAKAEGVHPRNAARPARRTDRPATRFRRLLRARWTLSASVFAADDRDSRAGRGRSGIVVCSPRPAPETLAAAALLGVTEFYRIGGAQAIAALAYGTEVHRTGREDRRPGNRFVTTAKKLVTFDCAIDMLAGPTEAIVVAEDGDAAFIGLRPRRAGRARSRHAVVVFVTSNAETCAVKSLRELKSRRRPTTSPCEVARPQWRYLRDRLTSAVDRGCERHRLRAHHVSRAINSTDITSAGSIFVGPYSPQSLGDYASGPNHVLPTGDVARYRGGLSVLDF